MKSLATYTEYKVIRESEREHFKYAIYYCGRFLSATVTYALALHHVECHMQIRHKAIQKRAIDFTSSYFNRVPIMLPTIR